VFQAGALLALIGGALVVMPSAAQAADPTVQITSLTSGNLRAGDKATMKYRVTNKNPAGGDSAFTIVVSSTINEVTCDGNACNFNDEIQGGASKEFTVTLVGGALASGESKPGQIQIRAEVGDDSATTQRPITLRGDEKSPTVREVAGKVRDQSGKAVSGAQVGLTDSANHQYTTDTNGSGNFRFTSTDQQPIAPGAITVGARKDGFQIVTSNVNGQAGKSLNVSLTMRSESAPTPSATPTPTASATEEPVDEATDEATVAPVNPAPVAGSTDDDSSGSLVYIIIGGLLVAAGIGAIVLVLMRRKDGDAEADPDAEDAVASGARADAVPASRYGGAADATRIANRGADATMLAGAPVRPSLSDAPTMLQQAVPADEFPDPYGAPAAIPHAGYAAARPGGWGTPAAAGAAGAAAAGAYGAAAPAATPYGAPAPGGYGAAAPATPTSTYGAAGGYGAPAQPAPSGAYGAPADDYPAAPSTQYGRPPAQAGAYGAPGAGAEPYGQPSSGAGYGGAPSAAGAYGAADQQRYDEPTGRYDPAAGGGAAGGYRGDAGYEQGGGYRPQDQGGAYGAPAQGRSADAAGGPGGFRSSAPAGGYPAAEPEYPQPGRQQPGSGAPYQAGVPYQAGGYQQPAGGAAANGRAAEQTPYGSWSPGGGIDSGNAYGAPAGNYGRPGGYGAAPAAGGYDEPTGYEPRGAYGRPEGYGTPEQPQGRAPQAPGRSPQQGGYDEPGYYGAEQAPPGGRHGGQPQAEPLAPRRPLDWLDD
jgi:hypothetical protein